MTTDAATTVRFASATPQFTVPALARTAQYYRDVLGFELVGSWGTPPAFAIVRRDAVELFFNQATDARPRTGRAPGAYDLYLRVAGVEALAAELRSRGADVLEGPSLRVYGQLELVVRDCNGLVLAFGEPVSRPSAT